MLASIRKQAQRNAAGDAAMMRLVALAKAEGKSLRDIGAAAGMTPEGVRKMIARAKRQTPENAPEDAQPDV